MTLIFSVQSKFDVGLESYNLDEAGYSHIVQGHRGLANFILTGVKDTVCNPTHVYTSAYDVRRLQFLSREVLTATGKPMSVIIQIEDTYGRVITASPRSKVIGELVWDAGTGFYVSYDASADIFYMSSGDKCAVYAADDEEEPRLWWRFRDDNDAHVGVTVFEASRLWTLKPDFLVNQISAFLSLDKADVRGRFQSRLQPGL